VVRDTPLAAEARIVRGVDTPRVALLNAKAVDTVNNPALIGTGTETIRCAFAGNPGHRETPPTLGDRGRPGSAAVLINDYDHRRDPARSRSLRHINGSRC
jgi:hypothetical protein